MTNHYTQNNFNGKPVTSEKQNEETAHNTFDTPEPPHKRGRGRPKSSRNKPKIHGKSCPVPFFMYKINENNKNDSLPDSLHDSNTHSFSIIYVKLNQENPPWSRGISFYRNFKKSLHGYELATKKQYIILMRNHEITGQLPDYHVIINFFTPMVIDDFKAARSKAFGHLSKLGVRAFYVHEPSRGKSWLHVHSMMIFDGSNDTLREHIKEAFENTCLVCNQDFKVKVLPINKTKEDFQRLSSYILKFNGNRKYNRRKPLLFIKEVTLNKVGKFGQWFAKGKGKIWEEYKEECQKRREQAETNGSRTSFDEFDGFPVDW